MPCGWGSEPCDPTAYPAGEEFGPQATAECCARGGCHFGCAAPEGEGEETAGPEWTRALAVPRGNQRSPSWLYLPDYPFPQPDPSKVQAIMASDFGVAWKWDPYQHRADPENLDLLTPIP
ncbi:hypothetical protein NDU88_006477 [Pleurodeles waltl]|uniref:Uncharacterized protein n=1 Tax=Pleurodeles waltl TaxID=8319 RepID=A0AAV7TDQ0_PLEWA|nr:hypothetical protein NDU88_006477 [Pleurodeles waltl]